MFSFVLPFQCPPPEIQKRKKNNSPTPASNSGSSTGSGIIDSSWLRSLSAWRASRAAVLLTPVVNRLAAGVSGDGGGVDDVESSALSDSPPSAAPSLSSSLPLLPRSFSGVARGARGCFVVVLRDDEARTEERRRSRRGDGIAVDDGTKAAVVSAAEAL